MSTPSTGGKRSDATRAAILAAARARFATDGYERATIRAVAADADIDPSLVMRYFGTKEGLFAAASTFDVRLPEIDLDGAEPAGTQLARHLLHRWEEDDVLIALLRVAVTNPAGVERVQEVFATQIVPTVRAVTPDPARAQTRAALIASQVLGLALTRYVLRLPAVVALSAEELVAWLGPTLQRYLVQDPADQGHSA